jgi:hypothetical protein
VRPGRRVGVLAAVLVAGGLACGGVASSGDASETAASGGTSASPGTPGVLVPKWITLGPSAPPDPARTGPWLAFDGDPKTAFLDPNVGLAASLAAPSDVASVTVDPASPTTVVIKGRDEAYELREKTVELDRAGPSTVALDWPAMRSVWVAAPGTPLREITLRGVGPSASAEGWERYHEPRGGLEGSSPRIGLNETGTLWEFYAAADRPVAMPDGEGGLFAGQGAAVSFDGGRLTIETRDGDRRTWDVFRLGCMLVVEDVVMVAEPCGPTEGG